MIELKLGFERLIVPRFPVEALCAYDARRFGGVELLDALRDHADTSRSLWEGHWPGRPAAD